MQASKPYRFHPQAWKEVEDADDWYRQRSPETSIRFLSALNDGLESSARWPRRWPAYEHGTRRYILYRFPFSIIYQDEPNAVTILALAHLKRRPGYWRARL